MKLSRVVGILLVVFTITVILAGTFSAGFITGQYFELAGNSPAGVGQNDLTVGSLLDVLPSSEQPDREALFKPFWQAWDLVHERFVQQPVDDVVLMRGAIQGMLGALDDKYSSYLDPEMTKRFEASLNGEDYEGIGAYIDITGEYLEIISPIPGTPAEKAGLQPGDLIIAVDGEDMTGVDGSLVHKRVLGPKGTKVVLTIQREGVQEPFDVEITRDVINIPTVESKMLEDNIAYIRLNTFGGDTGKEFKKALGELLRQKPAGLILDLRNNGGGLLQTAEEIASQFINEDILLYEEYGNGQREEIKTNANGIATDIPMVVLINEGSASASEIVAGAIQDLERGKLVGVTSFGKGSVQVVVKLVDDQGQVRITVARWLTPDGRQINEVGLEPDFRVEMTEEDRAADRDPQLDKAIELLQK